MKVGDHVAKYILLKELGHGGMGGVWIAFDPDTDDLVAVKTLFEEFCNDELYVKRFQREVDVLKKLQHPNVVGFRGAGRTDRTYYMALERIRGKDLAQIVKEQKRLGIPEAMQIMMGICRALGHAHQKGVIHRDIKPSNIMVTDEGKVPKILDFGVAYAEDAHLMTATGDIVGTFLYAAPEQNQGKQVDERSDIYALGLVFYELLTGIRALVGQTHQEVTTMQLTQRIPAPSEQNSGVPQQLDTIIMKMLSADPEGRYQNADELLLELEMFQSDPKSFSEDRRSIYEYPELVGEFKRAQNALKASAFDEALDVGKELAAKAPRAAEIYVLLGQAQRGKGFPFNAINELKRAITFDRGNIGYHMELASTYEELGMMGPAREEYQVILEIEPNSSVARQKLDGVIALSTPGRSASTASSQNDLNAGFANAKRRTSLQGHEGYRTLSPELLENAQAEAAEPPAADEAAGLSEEDRMKLQARLRGVLPEVMPPASTAALAALIWPTGFYRLGLNNATSLAIVAELGLVLGLVFGLVNPLFVPPEFLGDGLQAWAAANPGESAAWMVRLCGAGFLLGAIWIGMEVFNGVRARNLQAYVLEADSRQETVVLNAGSLAGFAVGDKLSLYQEERPGSGAGRAIGEVQLIEVLPERATGRFHAGGDRAARIGDFAVAPATVTEGWLDPTRPHPRRFPDLSSLLGRSSLT